MRGDTGVDDQVEEALEWVGLAGFGPRAIDGLSGGEQQRVALARTLAPRPKLVMLDEPLGALDRDLRRRLLEEIHEILEVRRLTALVVTHDRDEAATLSDRLVLMRDGTVVQTGTLEELTERPADEWVRSFLA
jgi:thiamine transport system ATP-binding protein